MVVLKSYGPFPAENFVSVKFKGFRGSSRSEVEFRLADLLCMNPNDWISLFLILSKDEQKYEPMVAYMKRILIFCIHEVANMDIEVAAVIKKKPVVKPEPELKDFRKVKLGKINIENWNVLYQRRDGEKVVKIIFFLLDKNLYPTAALNKILGLVEATKSSNADDLKCFTDMLKWYPTFRNTLLN
ncbi:unnamed protein product [Lactuca saligna]|uniref:Uncharacterized protein n=1 Tax=Lactuca saligna TaxID=75948 RepID=A0AA35ZQE3_LACSI|nr:unnamed protein product [Lactuca saligna]